MFLNCCVEWMDAPVPSAITALGPNMPRSPARDRPRRRNSPIARLSPPNRHRAPTAQAPRLGPCRAPANKQKPEPLNCRAGRDVCRAPEQRRHHENQKKKLGSRESMLGDSAGPLIEPYLSQSWRQRDFVAAGYRSLRDGQGSGRDPRPGPRPPPRSPPRANCRVSACRNTRRHLP